MSGTGNTSDGNIGISGTGDAIGGVPISILGTCHEWYAPARACLLDLKQGNATAWYVAVSATGDAQGKWVSISPSKASEGEVAVTIFGQSGHSDQPGADSTVLALSVFGDSAACMGDPTCIAISGVGHSRGGTAISGCDKWGLCIPAPARLP